MRLVETKAIGDGLVHLTYEFVREASGRRYDEARAFASFEDGPGRRL